MKIHHHTITLFGETVFFVEPECYHGKETQEMELWLRANIASDRWCFFPSENVIFLFRHEEDFLMFKLRWSGDDTVSV